MEYLSGYATTSNLDLLCVTDNTIIFNLANLQSSFIASTANTVGGPPASLLKSPGS
jgi:hypothetical protein